MPLTPVRYELDITGINPNNKVTAEPHSLSNRSVRAIALEFGLFFADSVQIKDVATDTYLNNTQFQSVEFQVFPSARYGKNICGVIIITDPAVSQNVEVTYQVLGGEYTSNSSTIVNMLQNLDLDSRPVNWPLILHKPSGFNPAPHYHDIGDVYGFEYITHALERLRTAILIGDEAAHDELRRYIDQWGQTLNGMINASGQNISGHTTDTNNPHATTKAQVGLGLVDNYATASTAEAQAGTANNKFMTPSLVKQAIDQFAAPLNHTHTFASLTSKPTTLAGYGVNSVDVTGAVTTGTNVKVNAAGGNYSQLNSTEVSFVGANTYKQGGISCTTNIGLNNGGTIEYQAANHSFLGNVGSTGDITYYASDERLKQNITPITDGLSKLIKIGAYRYNWDVEKCSELGFTPERYQEHGLIAQKVNEVYPEAVGPTSFSPEYLTVKHHRMVPLLISSVIELNDRLKKAEEQIKILLENK